MRGRAPRALEVAGAALLLLAAACGEAPTATARRAASARPSALASAACSPTGSHPKHASFACHTCHVCDGVVEFDPTGAAMGSGQPAPSFDPATKSCASVACHGVAPGTFSYYTQDAMGDAVLTAFAYGGSPRPTPAWGSTGTGCSACHDNPPRGATWHSGAHAGQGPSGPANQCQFCHPDATGANGQGTGVTVAALHGNGKVDVQATFTSRCFGCH